MRCTACQQELAKTDTACWNCGKPVNQRRAMIKPTMPERVAASPGWRRGRERFRLRRIRGYWRLARSPENEG